MVIPVRFSDETLKSIVVRDVAKTVDRTSMNHADNQMKSEDSSRSR